MCLEFSSCFGGGGDDYGGEPSNRNEGGGRRRDRRRNNTNDYYAGGDHKEPQATYRYQPPVPVDEAGQKAYHDGWRKADHAGAGGRGGYPAYAPRPNEVGHDAYTRRLQDHRNNATMDHHHYQTPTTNLGRY